jgi:hypothetical protein
MSLKTDLEQRIRKSYNLIRQYEDIIAVSSDPKEKERSRQHIQEQQELIIVPRGCVSQRRSFVCKIRLTSGTAGVPRSGFA